MANPSFFSKQVSSLLAFGCARLWDYDDLPEETMSETNELWQKAKRDPPVPTMDFEQLKRLRAEFRNLVSILLSIRLCRPCLVLIDFPLFFRNVIHVNARDTSIYDRFRQFMLSSTEFLTRGEVLRRHHLLQVLARLAATRIFHRFRFLVYYRPPRCET